MKVENKLTIAVNLVQQAHGHKLIQPNKLIPAVIDGEAIPTNQAVVLDPDAQCVLHGIERNITNFNNEGGVMQRVMSSNKTKI